MGAATYLRLGICLNRGVGSGNRGKQRRLRRQTRLTYLIYDSCSMITSKTGRARKEYIPSLRFLPWTKVPHLMSLFEPGRGGVGCRVAPLRSLIPVMHLQLNLEPKGDRLRVGAAPLVSDAGRSGAPANQAEPDQLCLKGQKRASSQDCASSSTTTAFNYPSRRARRERSILFDTSTTLPVYSVSHPRTERLRPIDSRIKCCRTEPLR